MDFREFRQHKVERARDLRRISTPAERALWKLLRAHQMEGRHFRRQHCIGPYFADFVCVQAKLIIELDGCSHEGREREDQMRDENLAAMGWETMRIWNYELKQSPKGVWLQIEAAIQNRNQEPQSSSNGSEK